MSRRHQPLNLVKLKQPILEVLQVIEAEVEARNHEADREREYLHQRREEEQRKIEELITLKAELEAQHAAHDARGFGLLACCYAPATERSLEIKARKERRQHIASYAAEAFEEADGDDNFELSVEELRLIEGENAELVMKEADVNGDGVLSKEEYVNYKMHVAKQVGRLARKAFRDADVNHDKELTVDELRVIEGDNAERVMAEADVDCSGQLSKREYVDYKIRQVVHGVATLKQMRAEQKAMTRAHTKA